MMRVAALRSSSFRVGSVFSSSTRTVTYRGSVESMLASWPSYFIRARSAGGRHRWTVPAWVPTTMNGTSLLGLNAPQVIPTRPGVSSRATSLPRPPPAGAVHTCSPPFNSPSPPPVTR